MAAYVNQFGRKWGRGVRPWLLTPKVLMVGCYLGTLVASLVIWVATEFASPLSGEARAAVDHVSVLARYVAVPAFLLAIAFGVGLFLQHPREFWRMRWVRVKLAALAVLIPAAHLFLSSRLALVREGGAEAPFHARSFAVGLGVTAVASAAVIAIARLKPRLGQDYAQAFPFRPKGEPATTPK